MDLNPESEGRQLRVRTKINMADQDVDDDIAAMAKSISDENRELFKENIRLHEVISTWRCYIFLDSLKLINIVGGSHGHRTQHGLLLLHRSQL